MAEYIDREAFITEKRKQYCGDCDKRKGIKNGKLKFCYEIGEAPCRSCGVDDALSDIEDYPAADVVEVVRCKDCRHRPFSTEPGKTYGLTIEAPDDRCPCYNEDDGWYSWVPDNEFFCSYGERKGAE